MYSLLLKLQYEIHVHIKKTAVIHRKVGNSYMHLKIISWKDKGKEKQTTMYKTRLH